MTHLTSPSFLIIATMFTGMINLASPFITKEDSNLRSILLISVSAFFLFNVLIIDYLFIRGTEANFTILSVDKYSISFGLESFGLIFLTLLGVLWIPALLYTIKFLAINNFTNTSRYLFFVNSCILSGCFVALSWNLITMFIGYEILTLCTIPLIIHQTNTKTVTGLFRYLKILMISSLILFLPAVIFIYSNIGTGTFTNNGFIRDYFSDATSVCLLIVFIFGISKTAIYPLYGWLPAAMVASYPVSALLHAVVVVKTGLFCIYKVIIYVFGFEYLQYLFINYNWLVLLPAFTILYSSIGALRSNEIKIILAFSTINQLSLALISAFLLTPKGMIGAIMHMLSHAFTKICMFYSAGNFYSVKHTYYTNQLTGINKIMPKTSFIMLIASLSLIGMPPFAGFISKFYIMLAAADAQNLFVMIILGISTICSSVYMIKILRFIYKNSAPSDEEFANSSEIPKRFFTKHNDGVSLFMLTSLAICISLVVCFFFIQQIANMFLTFI